jgi:2-polyprenyl-6-methoxyphenol hydroxylase-like FAD-dependent oxidoreductase
VRIACVGGGPAGLSFAVLMKLCGPGNEVTVYERDKAGMVRGGGVTVERKFLATLARTDPESAQQIGRSAVRWQDLVISYRGERDVHHDSAPSYGVSLQRLTDVLAARAAQVGVDIRYGHEVRSAAELRDADLILAADGAGSALRTSQPGFGTTVREGRNKFAWLGTSKAFDTFTFIFEQTDAGWIWAYAYQFAPAASTFVVECPRETWDRLGLADGPATVGLDKIEEIFAAHLDGHPLSAQLPDGTDARWLSFQTVSNVRWQHGRMALAGDSAHAAHFSAWSGTALAIDDVLALVGQLRGSTCLMAAGYGRGHEVKLSCLSPTLVAYQKRRSAAVRQELAEASRSAALLENLSRYAGLAPSQFAQAVRARRAPLLPVLPPRVFGMLHRVRERL